MRALAIDSRPGVGQLADRLRMMDLPVPEPGRGQVRVRIEATAINVDDQHLAEGTMFGGFPVSPTPTPERPWVPGTDLVGTVDAVGPGVRGVEPGQRVYGMRPPKLAGPWAEQGITKASFVAPVPSGWSPAETASLCLGGMVVCSIVRALGAPQGKHCVVVGASGSIGTLLVPVLQRAGARVWGVCSSRNQELVASLGAERVIDYGQGPFGEQIATLGIEVDAVIDLLGGLTTERQGMAVTRRAGAFITIVGPHQHVGERKLGVGGLVAMLGHIGWAWARSRVSGPRYDLVGPLSPDFAAIDRWIVSQGIRPIVDHEVPFEEAPVREAIRYVASHRARGKVVITAVA